LLRPSLISLPRVGREVGAPDQRPRERPTQRRIERGALTQHGYGARTALGVPTTANVIAAN
jgi:hypothetical protein